jgi:hypothetical protein
LTEPCPSPWDFFSPRSIRYAAQGEMMKAMKSEKSIATEAPTGMGRM